QPCSLLERARAARRAAWHEELGDDQACVDSFYESAVFAYFAYNAAADPSLPDARKASRLYNQSLGDALRNADRYGRIDPRSQCMVNSPRGSMVVPVVHRGFVWSPADFHRLTDPRDTTPGQSQSTPHRCDGIGSPRVVMRSNPRANSSDQFLPPRSFFPASAILRPDPATWLGTPGAAVGQDELVLHDSYRVTEVDLGGRPTPLAADFDAAYAMAEEAANGRRMTLAGFLNPTVELSNAGIRILEPYQPGKTIV